MILFAKWKVTNPEKLAEVFRHLVTEEFNQSNGFKLEGDLFECKIEMSNNKPQKALEAMSQIGNILSFSYNYPDNEKEEQDVSEALDRNTQFESDENDQETNQSDSGKHEHESSKVLSQNMQLESAEKDEESKQPDEDQKEHKSEKKLDSLEKQEYANDDLIGQIAENAVSYPDFVSKVASRAESLSKEHRAALVEMMLAAPTVKKFTLSTIETVASQKTPINSYTMLKVGDEIKRTFNYTKMDFFKKVISFFHNWDDITLVKQIKEEHKQEEDSKKHETEKEFEACKKTDAGNKSDDEREKGKDDGSSTTNIEHYDGIFPCMLVPAADKVEALDILEGKLRKIEDRSDLSLKEKVSEVIHVLVPSESVAKFESMSEKTAEILQREEIAYDDQTPLDEKDVYLQWSNIANLVSEFYFGHVPETPIKAKYFLLDLKKLLVK